MPRTEAGKRLLAKVNAEPPIGMLLPEDIDAIEAEARAGAFDQRDELLDDLTAEWEAKVAEAVAANAEEIAAGAALAERERIVRAVEGLSRYESMTPEWYAACVAVLAIVREVEGLPGDELIDSYGGAEMCPNCVTPWKCNGPHDPPPVEGTTRLAPCVEICNMEGHPHWPREAPG